MTYEIKNHSDSLVFENEKWQVKRRSRVYECDRPTRSFGANCILNEETTEILPLSKYHIKLGKSIVFEFIQKEVMANTFERPIPSRYMLKAAKANVPDSKSTKHIFLSVTNGVPFIHDLHFGFTHPLGLTHEYTTIQKKSKQLEPQEVLTLLKSKKVYPKILQKVGSEWRELL